MSEYTRFEARLRCMVSGSEIVQWSSLSKGDREAIAWAVAEIDRLRTELEEHRTAAEYYAAALGMCEAKLTHVRDELTEAKADMEQVIDDVKAEPPRPAAMLWTDATEWHAYEQWEDADRDRNQAVKEPPLMVVKKWTWHPKSS